MVQLANVNKIYERAGVQQPALRGIDLAIRRGEFVAIVGKSGSGKSTLMNMITGIDQPSAGAVWVNDTPIHQLDENQLARWRGETLGIIFQFFQLLPTLTVLENVLLPMDFLPDYDATLAEERARQLLALVEMSDHADKLPTALSGGQQQRVAIARALANDPPLLIADEPTGNLDSKTAARIFHLFEVLVDLGKTIVMVTHDSDLAQRAQRAVTLADGAIVADRLHAGCLDGIVLEGVLRE
jgi:putative ABC transport system ATP-binding protein